MNKKEIWKKVLAYIKENVTQVTFNTFIKPLKLKGIQQDPDIVYVESEDEFFLGIINQRYHHHFEDGFREVTGKPFRVVIKSSQDFQNDEPAIFSMPENTLNNTTSTSTFSSNSANPSLDFNPSFLKEKIFNPTYTFENFVQGDSNKYAYAASYAVADSPGKVYNPLFIYGGSGLGKTHLINAIGIHILERNSNVRILYVSSETFTNDFIKALQDGKTREFKAKYRKADVLLIDDIQFLEGKETMQEEFFHTFNALYDDHKQIIISSDRPPKELTKLHERLRSRFGWNMITPINPPGYETRVAILLKKAENMNIDVNDNLYEIIKLISEKITDNIRELEGAFNRIISFSELMGEKADVSFANRILADIIKNDGKSITPENIKTKTARYYGITVSDLESKKRVHEIAFPRQVAMYICREMTDYSLAKIGNIFGGRHHTTVNHAWEKIDTEIKKDKNLASAVEEIKSMISDK